MEKKKLTLKEKKILQEQKRELSIIDEAFKRGLATGESLGYEKGMNRGMLTMFFLGLVALALSVIMRLLGVW